MCDPDFDHEAWEADENNPAIEELMRARNCVGDESATAGAMLNLPFASDLQQCPRSYICAGSITWVKLASQYKRHGILPYPGEAGDQPARVIEAFDVIEAAVQAYEVEQHSRPLTPTEVRDG